MMKRMVSNDVYNRAHLIFSQIGSTMNSDMSWDMKYDLVFGHDIGWLKDNFGLNDIKGDG
jgi:hypothetical protein